MGLRRVEVRQGTATFGLLIVAVLELFSLVLKLLRENSIYNVNPVYTPKVGK